MSEEAPTARANSPREPPVGRRWRWGWIVALVALLFTAEAVLIPPSRQPTTRLLLTGIDLYQRFGSPRLAAAGVRCRFEPSCSHYGEAVIARFGALRGTGMTAWRLMRCGPWTPARTFDPPPTADGSGAGGADQQAEPGLG